MYLDEQKADNQHQAAILADYYSLTHKTTFPSKSEHSGTSSDRKSFEVRRQSPPITRSRNHNQGRGHFDNFHELAGGPACYYCKKRGHVMAECPQDLLFNLQVVETNTIPSFLKAIPIDILRDTGATKS